MLEHDFVAAGEKIEAKGKVDISERVDLPARIKNLLAAEVVITVREDRDSAALVAQGSEESAPDISRTPQVQGRRVGENAVDHGALDEKPPQ